VSEAHDARPNYVGGSSGRLVPRGTGVVSRVAEWRTALRLNALEARRVLRLLVAERIGFESIERKGHRIYRYSGRFTLAGLFEGTVCPQMLASPPGFAKGCT
jgi:hypothetical protein